MEARKGGRGKRRGSRWKEIALGRRGRKGGGRETGKDELEMMGKDGKGG